ncbi:UDP-galactopyranose mutase [Rhizobium leguminosarum]|uniref:UDP-galactopyranose mutase n=1 Tax=Rhizobium leguminosarum TaxID=384 RepID=A0AAJ1ABV5_RHILE|nr:UDP-galactopyranose mutase [Rhizobium leguminosarum]MBY5533837.1 UDP-galactopyranose mutase [Rhizobium leguminosarum]MBY5594925.1 UDP-galactopyranose mutase [Rhizobium leguminosarum]MBY5609253.1 UDP-galactopyranose mutase [Rhizobium leguminosarum]MBY5630950.1 UDP-galactopyranose mutase [Rhizobium leguminosarum]MBY5652683.1 UDP-galactopyranose mutase [Rhizobium leguminosarum]
MNLLNSVPQLSDNSLLEHAPLICFSHLRWDFVLQRPQHLMERFSRERPVFYFEEFIPTDHHLAYLEIHPFEGTSVKAVRPRIPHWWNAAEQEAALRRLLDDLILLHGGKRPILWFYTPLMFGFARHVDAVAIVYDCMDELANFKFAPPNLKACEQALMASADVVFTGGLSLYEARQDQHDNIHPFPSGVDTHHFHAARCSLPVPADQADIPQPRLGYYGVIDERLDLDLVSSVASARPDLSFVFLGPIVKISPDNLPRGANIHYLGQKAYADLPAYLSSWRAALMPFALNEATRFISPTKTPEYLAAGRPVVGTQIVDVVRGYSDVPGVFLANGTEAFAEACDAALLLSCSDPAWLEAVDGVLAQSSWDSTFCRMSALLERAAAQKIVSAALPERFRVGTSRRAPSDTYDYLIVGAGFAGSVLAERLAVDGGKKVLVCDRRSHIGGNTYDHYDEAAILVHKYGPHIFHTNSEDIVAYLSRFTAWRPYEHRVLAQVGDLRLPIPINRTTLNALYNIDLTSDAEAARFLAERAEPCDPVKTSRDVVISQVGAELYRTFFEGYTRKQWGLDPSELDRSVTARIPTRTNTDDRYFLDRFQAMPLDGYTRMFERMLNHDNITVMVGTDFADLRREGLADHTIFTGPIDEYFGHCFGRLPYRSLKFIHETRDVRRLLPVAVINFPSEDVPHTRVTEYKHLTGQVHPRTSISYEYASAEGEPYYPIPRPENQALYKQYETLARTRDDVTFVGRLGTYKYYNMDQVVGQALATYRRLRDRQVASKALVGAQHV